MAFNVIRTDVSVTLMLFVLALTTQLHVNCEKLVGISGSTGFQFSLPSIENDTRQLDLHRITKTVPLGTKVLRIPNLLRDRSITVIKTSLPNSMKEKRHPLLASLKRGKQTRRKKNPSSKEIKDARRPERSNRRKKNKKKKHSHRHRWQDWSSSNTPPVHTQYDRFPGYVPHIPGGIPAFVPHGPFHPYYPEVHGYYPIHHYHSPYNPAATPSRTTPFPSTISTTTKKVDSGMVFPPFPGVPMTTTKKTPDNPTNTTPSTTITRLTSTVISKSTPTTQPTSTTDPDAEYIPPYLYDRTGEIPSRINCTFSRQR